MSLKVIGDVTVRQSAFGFLQPFRSNYGPILHRFPHPDIGRSCKIYMSTCTQRPRRGWPRRGWPRRKFAKMFSSMFNVEIEEAHTCKYFGVYLDDQLNWKHHIDYIYEKLVKFTGIFYRLRSKISSEWLTNIYYYFAYAHLLYGIETYSNTTCVKLLIYTVFKKNMWPRFWW